MYQYQATVLRVLDGDTVDVDLDLGCDVHVRLALRLAGINAPEMHKVGGGQNPAGIAAKEHLAHLLGTDPAIPAVGANIIVNTVKDRQEKYGRYLAYLVVNGAEINQMMIDDGFAVAYAGGAR